MFNQVLVLLREKILQKEVICLTNILNVFSAIPMYVFQNNTSIFIILLFL